MRERARASSLSRALLADRQANITTAMSRPSVSFSRGEHDVVMSFAGHRVLPGHHSGGNVTWTNPITSRTRDGRRRLSAVVSLTTLAVTPLTRSLAQAPPTAPPAIGSPLKPPLLQLVQPPPGSTIPSDRPTVFYRYSPGDATDPIDDSSFQLWIDGIERTSGFRVGNGEAWGRLGEGQTLSPGAHLVIARVCSVRSICSAANDVVIAVPTAAVPAADVGAANRRVARDSVRVRRHQRWKQPQTLLGDLLSNVVKLFRH